MPTVYINGQPFDSDDLGTRAREIIDAARVEEDAAARAEREASDALRQAKTADQIRLAELRLERVRTQRESRLAQIEAQAAAAERAEAARRETERARRETAERNEQLRREREERLAQQRAEQTAVRQRQTRARTSTRVAARPRHEVVSVGGRGATATGILPESAEIRFLDAGIVAGVAGGTVLYTASRPTASGQVGAGLLWMALGALMLVEGRGALLRYGGAGLLGANAAYLALRTFHSNLSAPAAATTQQVRLIRVGRTFVAVESLAA